MMQAQDVVISRKSVGALALGVFLVLAAAMPSSEAYGGGWMFQRSYYSHDIPPEKAADYPRPHSRSAYRRAITGYGPGVAVRGGYRYKRIYMRSGNSTDLTVIREDWFDVLP